MRAVRRGDPVEIMIGILYVMVLPFRKKRRVLAMLEVLHPGAFHRLEGLGNNERELLVRMLFRHEPLFEREPEIFHFLGRLVARPAEADDFLKGLPVVRQEVDDALFSAQDVLRGIGRIPAAEHHGVVVFSCNIERLYEGVRPARGLPVLCQRADEHDRHREKEGCLIEVVDDSEIFKAAHWFLS